MQSQDKRREDHITHTRAADIGPGDMIDLEGDEYADPRGDGTDDDDHYYAFEFEYALVEDVDGSAARSGFGVTLYTTLGVFSFPAEHKLKRWAQS